MSVAMSVLRFLYLATVVSALHVLLIRDTSGNNSSDDNTPLLPYSVPGGAQPLRRSDIATKQLTFTYGPAVGVGPFYPAGALGSTYNTVDSTETDAELTAQLLISEPDYTKANLDKEQYNGLQTVDDYTKLYDGEWQHSSEPTGQYAGILTNYTRDLLFSMERLSYAPFAVRRLDPSKDGIPFIVDDSIVSNVTGQTLTSLFTSGRLFYVDHRNQTSLERATDKYSANCDALFYISSSSGDFLPLAIRTNFGSNLIYTPLDTPDDWLLAKIMYNVNDFFMHQLDHFARTHFTSEILYEAGVRTLSDDHPVLAILQRLLFGAFAIRPIALIVLFRSGGTFDELFGIGSAGAATFSNDTYFNGYAGAIKANYFRTNLERRGLINSTTGPALKSFPFYEDAAAIYDAIRTFTGTFVSSYYANDAAVASDSELQAWVAEARGPAQAIDFPASLATVSDLADLIAEVGRGVSASHHAVNTNQLITGGGTVHFHPPGLYKPVPTAKNVTDVASFLPPLAKALEMIDAAARFARPLIAGSNRTLIHMFNDPIMLSRMNAETRAANTEFMAAMRARSEVVSNRSFDENGLSQGMPFVWKALDPNVIPWSLTV